MGSAWTSGKREGVGRVTRIDWWDWFRAHEEWRWSSLLSEEMGLRSKAQNLKPYRNENHKLFTNALK